MRRLSRGLLNRWWRLGSRLGRLSSRLKPRDPTIVVVGPAWLSHLLSVEARVVPSSSAEPRSGVALVLVGPNGGDTSIGPYREAGTPVVGYRSSVEPAIDTGGFVEPVLSNPLRLNPPKGLPHDLDLLARQAARTVEPRRPSRWPSPDAEAWLEETASAHLAYRRAHSRRARDLLEEAFAAAGGNLPSQGEDITVVCVTNRPANLDNIIANYQRQRYPHRRLLLVTNSGMFDEESVREALTSALDSSRIHVEEGLSLGHCLNVALDSCSTRFLAKIDDDDWYGPDYLGDLVIARRFADAAVMGKHTYYAYVEARDQTVIRFPGHEFEYTSFVAGGTLMIDVPLVSGIRFPDRTVGEDSGFLALCQRKGLGVFSADRFNYLQVRGEANTWKANLDKYLAKSVPVARGPAKDLVEV